MFAIDVINLFAFLQRLNKCISNKSVNQKCFARHDSGASISQSNFSIRLSSSVILFYTKRHNKLRHWNF